MKNTEMPILTTFEIQAMKAIVKGLYAELGFSDIDAKDISVATKIEMKSLRGILSSLEQKGLIYIEDGATINERSKQTYQIIYLTARRVEKQKIVGCQFHKEYADELGLPYINLDALTTRTSGTHNVSVVGNQRVGIIKKSKKGPKQDLTKLTYQQLAKMYGNGFVGKSKSTLISLLTK